MICQCECHRKYQHVVYALSNLGSDISELTELPLHNSIRCTECGHVPGNGTTHYVVDNEVAP